VEEWGPPPTEGESAPPTRPDEPPRSPDDPRPPAQPRSRGPADEPTTISIRILVHLLRQGRYGADEVPPASFTQAGIARALSASQTWVSRALGLLVEGGAVRVETGHVRGRMVRIRIYTLTDKGEELARRLAERLRG
jgi:DNA-binding MarR family transcriptional regulator